MREFASRARKRGIEASVTALDRSLAASDAGNYRIPPAGLVYPRSAEDVAEALDLARELDIPVNSRGAATSCAGNAIGPGVLIDYARYMNQIIDIDPDTRTATVEPGVIQADLQAAAAPHQLRFGPDPSTSNRCTIGGMIGNNACGPRATAYGKTADNVVELWAIDGVGRRLHAGQGREGLAQVPGLAHLVDTNLALIRQTFGTFDRQVSGYSFEHLTPEGGANLAGFLVGSESTLATVTRARVRLVPVPAAPVLVVLGYRDMIEAADDVPALLRHHPIAIEGLDAQLVDVVRAHRGPGAVPELPDGQGWLMIEVGGEDLPSVDQALDAARRLVADASTDAARIYPPGSQAAALWRIRADGAGLGGRTPVRADGAGNDQAWPGWEDAAVPPEHLGKYLRDFQEVLDAHDIHGLIYGHFGAGCVHVRLDMPLDSAAGVGRSRAFLEAAADTVARYGGSLSGEHGDGRARSELLARMYSPAAVRLMAQAKALFDPDNLMNPGVITGPAEGGVDPLDAHLRRPDAREVSAEGGYPFADDGGSFTKAVHRCTGVSKCRADARGAGQFMCPTYLATGAEEDSTRGRARILQEAMNGSLIGGLDAPEVRVLLDRCMACKACSADCPTGVDMAAWRSELLYRRYRGKLRPRTHYVLGWLPTWLRLAQRIPGAARLGNRALAISSVRRLAFAMGGLNTDREMPPMQTMSFSRWAAESGIKEIRGCDPREVDNRHAQAPTRGPVVVWADSFSEGLDGSGARAIIELLRDLGFDVFVAPADACCGLTWITTGQLDRARKHLGRLLTRLGPWAVNGIPIIGVEPSCTAVLRDDLLRLIPDDPRAAAVAQMSRTLAEFLTESDCIAELPRLDGLDVVAQPHCHHYSVMGWETDRDLLTQLGANVHEISGCCGLAGNYGMEPQHRYISSAVAQATMLPVLRDHPEATVLADGFSCRTQIAYMGERRAYHLASLLRKHARTAAI
ncbi:FAD-binding and (Fe-S)-binding domain-containing protein [Nanchangia anserum]|uniref:FAD-binding and (Fe-S)-binding domain-containing protein n=1 Tax=Nanchangia anserum TaxID=2692125 RepID=UPI001D12308F|nr:FAD-binding and (Fe-S)-binding domain-containing protein [Nanchangia anserum]